MAKTVDIAIDTELGTIVVELYEEMAPVTTTNFLEHLARSHYDGGRFYRTVTMSNQPDDDVKIEVIQGGVGDSSIAEAATPIELERTSSTGLAHRDGTISMARKTPDSATTEFFICIGDQPELDYGGKRNPDGQGFAAFGQVKQGMDVVRAIQRSPQQGQRLNPVIDIVRIPRIEAGS